MANPSSPITHPVIPETGNYDLLNTSYYYPQYNSNADFFSFYTPIEPGVQNGSETTAQNSSGSSEQSAETPQASSTEATAPSKIASSNRKRRQEEGKKTTKASKKHRSTGVKSEINSAPKTTASKTSECNGNIHESFAPILTSQCYKYEMLRSCYEKLQHDYAHLLYRIQQNPSNGNPPGGNLSV